MRQQKFETGMYIVDSEYRIVNCNQAMKELYPQVQVGDVCYRSLALRDEVCEICPLRTDNALFYNPIRREWIYANAAQMEYPGHATCYNVQFQLRQRMGEVGQETILEEDMDEHIMELNGGSLDACAIGGYCDVGSPLFYANEQALQLLGYASVAELHTAIDGLVYNSIHPDDVARVTRDLTRCAQQGGTCESTYRIQHKDLSWSWVVGRGKRVQTKAGAYALLLVLTDMSGFMKRQSELREQNEKLLQKELTSQAVLDHMPGGYHRCANAEGWPFLYVGTSFEAITGWTREEIEMEFSNLFINLVYPEDVPLCEDIVENVKQNGYSNAVYRIKRKGGGYTWVSDSTMQVTINEETFFHGTLADVTPQIEELEKAKKVAEDSNQAKSAFLFNASHDIRTPMNAIQGFSQIIEQNADDPATVRETVRKLRQSGDILITLMNDVLELSRIERGKETVNNRPLNMFAHVNKLHEMLIPDMQESGIEFHMENDIQHPLVLADDLKLSRMAMNLLSNARKFTPRGGKVTFGVKESGCDGKKAVYTLCVRDTGIGMSKEFQARAFEQFERERSSTDSGISGSGLGLAIIKKIAELLGGECRIQSELGHGSEITCSVPLQLAREEDFQPEKAVDSVDFTGRRLLLVEDNSFNREIAKYMFEGMGFAVEEAVNGVECLNRVLQSPAGHFDLILMDVQMPVMDGYTATREIRRHRDARIAATPIIAMTANAFEEDRRKCLETGMNGHISKPIEPQNVLRELARVLQA